MRIAILLHDLRGGGAERVMLKLAAGLISRGHAVDLVLVRSGGALSPLIPPEARLVDLEGGRVWSAVPKLACYLRRVRPDWMISALTHINDAAALARLMSGVPTGLVVTEHTQISRRACSAQGVSARLTYALTPWLYRLADRVVAVSDGAAADLSAFARLPAGRVQRIYNPVFDDDLLEASRAEVQHPWLEGDHRVILAAGRLEPVKGFDILLRAFAQLSEREDCRLIILGEGPERSALETMATDLGIRDHLDLPGFVTNPYAMMSRAGVFVLSSHFEGLSLALLEALACGTPVVATDCPSGPAEILENGRFGTLVGVGDVPAMADAISASLALPRGQHVSRARAFSTDTAVEAYLNLIQPGRPPRGA